MSLLLALAPGLPLLAALLLYLNRRIPILPTVVIPLIPSFVLLLTEGDNGILNYPGILLGLKLGVDTLSRTFLLLTALLWIVCGIYATFYMRGEETRERFFLYYLLCMSGNIGVLLSQDIPGFYMFFALMSFAAYGLVVHEGTAEALRAGRVYIVMVVVGEALLAIGLFLAADAAGSTDLAGVRTAIAASGFHDLIIALILSGFGIKAGMLTLHMWMPLTYTAAPVPASALLGGSMINVGLLGWMRFLPLGEASFPEWGWFCILAGLIGAFFGVAVGMLQDNRKTILAYSSISQMGIMIMGIGIGLMDAYAWTLVMPAVLLYALHHAFSKAALFLSTGLTGTIKKNSLRIPIFIGIVLPALALAGAPFTSGMLSKTALKQALVFLPSGLESRIGLILLAAAAATTLLMIRFIAVMAEESDAKKGQSATGLLIPWAVLLIAIILLFSPIAIHYLPLQAEFIAGLTFSPDKIMGALAPLLAGALAYVAFAGLRKTTVFRFTIPPGDILEYVIRLGDLLRRLSGTLSSHASGYRSMTPSGPRFIHKWLECLYNLENKLVTGTGGLIFFLIVAAGLFIFAFL